MHYQLKEGWYCQYFFVRNILATLYYVDILHLMSVGITDLLISTNSVIALSSQAHHHKHKYVYICQCNDESSLTSLPVRIGVLDSSEISNRTSKQETDIEITAYRGSDKQIDTFQTSGFRHIYTFINLTIWTKITFNSLGNLIFKTSFE